MIQFGRQNTISSFKRVSGQLSTSRMTLPLTDSGDLWDERRRLSVNFQRSTDDKKEGFTGERLAVVPRSTVVLAMRQPLLRHLMPTDAGYYPAARGHQCTREQGRTETVFIYCSSGSGWCEIAGQTHEISKSQLLVIPANTPHAYGASKTDPWTIHWFHAVGEDVPHYLDKLEVKHESPVVGMGVNLQLFSLFEDVLQGIEGGVTLAHVTYAAHSLVHLLGVILRCKDEFWQGESNSRERILKSIEFMKEHLREPLHISRLAAVVNLSRSHYTTLFRRVTGCAPLMYLNQVRMHHAVQLLSTTRLPIKSISDHLGFSEQFYFSRAFTKLHGQSPSEYRRRYGQSAFVSASEPTECSSRSV